MAFWSLEDRLGHASAAPARVPEPGSHHAIVARVAAGSGIAIVPRTVPRAVQVESEVAVYPLPEGFAKAGTMPVRRNGRQSGALDSMRRGLARIKR